MACAALWMGVGGGGGAGMGCPLAGSTWGGGGGSGARVIKTYAVGALTPGATLTLFIGSGGTGSIGGNPAFAGGNGARGQIDISWT